MKRCLFAALLVLPLLGSGSPREYDDRTKLNELVGVWEVVKAENCGFEMAGGGSDAIIFDTTHVTYKLGSQVLIAGTYKTTASCGGLAVLDEVFVEKHGQLITWHNIYQVDGDVLRIAYVMPNGSERPLDFQDKQHLFIYTLKRVK